MSLKSLKVENPILGGFYPDPSICRVGDKFYLVNSTFAYFPGLPIFESTDLAHWKQIGNVIHRPEQMTFDKNQISRGLFAPTIRYSNGTYFVICTHVENGGNFFVTAKNPEGPWSDPIWLPEADGIDPSLFFDDDGKVWYIGTHATPEYAYNGDNEIFLWELDISDIENGKAKFIGEQHGIWRGALRRCIWPEGPHVYKINGTYYLFHAEGGTCLDHAICVAKSDKLLEGWTGKPANPILTHRYLGKKAEITNVGHSDLVSAPDGSWWIVCLATRPYGNDDMENPGERFDDLGRETFLAPIEWEDGWPLIGTKDGLLQKSFTIPNFSNTDDASPSGITNHVQRDSFNDSELDPMYLTLHDSFAHRIDGKKIIDLESRKGYLRLSAKGEYTTSFQNVSFVGRRQQAMCWSASAFICPPSSGLAGITVYQSEAFHLRFEVDAAASKLRIVKIENNKKTVIKEKAYNKASENIVLNIEANYQNASFYFEETDDPSWTTDSKKKISMDANADLRFLSTMKAGGFVGNTIGVFADSGSDDAYVDWFEVINRF